jgi:hypothetical protein
LDRLREVNPVPEVDQQLSGRRSQADVHLRATPGGIEWLRRKYQRASRKQIRRHLGS